MRAVHYSDSFSFCGYIAFHVGLCSQQHSRLHEKAERTCVVGVELLCGYAAAARQRACGREGERRRRRATAVLQYLYRHREGATPPSSVLQRMLRSFAGVHEPAGASTVCRLEMGNITQCSSPALPWRCMSALLPPSQLARMESAASPACADWCRVRFASRSFSDKSCEQFRHHGP